MIIRDKIYISTTEVPESYLFELTKLFTYVNPEYHEKVRMGLYYQNTPTHLRHFNIIEKQVNGKNIRMYVFPRGGLDRICNSFSTNQVPYRIFDKRAEGYDIDVDFTSDITLEPHQVDIVEVLKTNGGLIESPPGSGKTIAVLKLIATLKKSTLILMHQHRLKTQWVAEIKKNLTGSFVLGSIDGDSKNEGDITIALINSVYIKMKDDPSFLEKYGVVVIDECHRVPAHMYINVLNHTPSKYRIGVTGTVKRKDERHTLLYDILGKPILVVKNTNLESRIMPFTVEAVLTDVEMQIPFIMRKGKSVIDYVNLITQLVQNEERNAVIVNTICKSIQEGYLPLVLSDRVAHLKYLHTTLTRAGYKSVLIIGENRTKVNWAEIRDDETIQCIVAQSSIASEGLDLPRLSALHLTCPSSNYPQLKQKVGRIRRYLPNKPIPKVYIYIDNGAYASLDSKNPFLLHSMGKRNIAFLNKLLLE